MTILLLLWATGALFTLGFTKNEYTTPNAADNIIVFVFNLIMCVWFWPFVLGMYIRDALS